MASVIQVTTHAVNVRSAPSAGASAPYALSQGQQATVDIYLLNTWLHTTAPHDGYVYAAPGYFELLDVVSPPPSGPGGSDATVDVKVNTDLLNERDKPSLSGTVVAELPRGTIVQVYSQHNVNADGHNWYQLYSTLPRWIAGDLTVNVDAPTPTPQPTPVPVPAPPIGAFALPFPANLYGGHMNPGGWVPGPDELAVFKRNHINYALVPAYSPDQQGSIDKLRGVGVQHFLIRPAITGGATAADFARITLPILEQYAAALGGTVNMMIQLGNEPNLVAEGWTKYWQAGSDFAIWWLNVSSVYRANLPGCRIGFAPMSPGGGQAGIRMDEAQFVSGCHAAINSADFAVVHKYWALPDGSDLEVPLTMWRQMFGAKALVIGESGPPIGQPNVTVQAVQHAHAMYIQANIPAIYFIMDSSGNGTFNNAGWLQRGITV